IILLSIRALASVVLELKIGIQLNVLAKGQQAAHIQVSRAPFLVLALIKGFGCDIRNKMVRANRKSTLHRQFIPIAPSKAPRFPIEINAVPVRNYNTSQWWKAKGHSLRRTIFDRSVWRSYGPVSALQY